MTARTYPTTKMCDGEFLARFEPTTRDTDVFVATSAKCGQTWLQSLLHHLKTRGRDPNFGGVGLHGVSPWLELPQNFFDKTVEVSRDARLAEMERVADPRVFKMHVVWEEIPRPPGSLARVMTITRDPRDVPYSMFAHFMAMRLAEPPPDDFDAYFEQWLDFGYYFKFVRSFWPHRHDPDVLWLRYEDLHRELRPQIRRIVEFLGWDVDDEAIDRVVSLADFKRMRTDETSTIFKDRSKWKDDGRFFREGGVGKNRARLSADQERRIIERARTEFSPECYAFVMSGD